MKNQAIYQTSLLSETLNSLTVSTQFLFEGAQRTFDSARQGCRNFLQSFRKAQKTAFKTAAKSLDQMFGTRPFNALAHFVSLVLGEEVSARKAFNLLHAFVAFFSMLFLGGNSLLFQFLLIVWFALTALQCKRDGWAAEVAE